jgi:co-chaperonin GroES (HSP10)
MRISLLESKWRQICPYGNAVLIIKDQDEGVSAGGIVIPDAHREYKRRGWVLAVGGGCRTKDGRVHLPPYKPGDYIFADRAFKRPDETEDELFHDPTILLIRGDEPYAFFHREDCVGGDSRYALPKQHEELLKRFAFKPEPQEAAG